MTRKLISGILSNSKTMDRDNFTNKKIETSGILMAQLFRKLYYDQITNLRSVVFKNDDWTPNSGSILNQIFMTNKFNASLATGNWSSKMSSMNKKAGVAQMLKRLTYLSSLSHLRRINSPINKTGKLVDPRKIHNSQYGYFCPAESPEGRQIGLLKNLSMGCIVSNYSASSIVKDIAETYPGFYNYLDRPSETITIDDIVILLNGEIIGYTKKPNGFVDLIVHNRRNGKINYSVSVSYKPETGEINMYTDGGRPLRILFVVNDDHTTVNITEELLAKIRSGDYRFIDLLNNGMIEYVDPNESETILIAQNLKTLYANTDKSYTHCEIDNSLIFGVAASLIPFAEHNQSTRVVFQCAQAKQAIGLNNLEVFDRMDTISHFLHYPQRPIVATRASDMIGLNESPSGQNIIVAIGCFGAYNIEDSLIMNRGAIERGLFKMTTYKTYKTDVKENTTTSCKEVFCNPTKREGVTGMKINSYAKLNEIGIAEVGSKVSKNDILVGKITPYIDKTDPERPVKYRDTSIQLKRGEVGIVDKILDIKDNISTDRIIKLRTRHDREPEIADKFSSRHGQKSTLGIILDEQDMPFTENGMVPDIIINPHCLPSRMTIGQILECVLGKAHIVEGELVDGSPFASEYDSNNIDKLLVARGFAGSGKETLIDGETGEEIGAKIFIGPTYYQRLKHLVSDKMHARATGPINRLTQQPTNGRSRDGGLRLGGMELDALHAHGINAFMHDKLFECSDKFHVHICDTCGTISNVNEENRFYECKICGKDATFSKIAMPYSSKLLLYELMGMGIMTKYDTSASNNG